jgi:hypothetical protein
VLVYANMDGSKKIPLQLTEMSEKPRCLKHIKSLPYTWKHNSARVTCALFVEFLTCLERRTAAKNWKILLFLHQCSIRQRYK